MEFRALVPANTPNKSDCRDPLRGSPTFLLPADLLNSNIGRDSFSNHIGGDSIIPIPDLEIDRLGDKRDLSGIRNHDSGVGLLSRSN
jgi:hypothetical protein